MQAIMLQHSATPGSADVSLPGVVPVPNAVPGPASSAAPSFASSAPPGSASSNPSGPILDATLGPMTTPVAAPVPVVTTFYCGKAPKIDRYSRENKGLYNKFVRQCEAAFDIKDNNTNAGRVAFGAAHLEDTSADV